MKKRWIAAAITAAFFMWLALAGACNLNLLLLQRQNECTLRFGALISALADPRERIMFFLFALIGITAILGMLFGHSYLNYRSDMFEVVPGFKIPRPEGQGQHGTAWFMPADQFASHFTVASTDCKNLIPPELALRYREERSEIDETSDKPD